MVPHNREKIGEIFLFSLFFRMSFLEIDPDDFIQALRLLHSRTPESSDELKKILDLYYMKQVSNV